ncbi:MAG: CPBP family intramembrane metalloprotease [Nanoarchaeales archaeon]|nr:CPBP family intramembrane metalloprotease [Nanoarchaeales archaeon]
MPKTKREVLVFTLVVSVIAGICEELIFRAYLLNFVEGYFSMFVAVILSSVVFGLWHMYLGVGYVVRTTLMGIMFSIIYLLSGNIIIPMIVHIFIDVYSGLMFYFGNKTY